MEGMIGKKIGMTQVYDAEGRRTCVTVVEVGPCPVVQLKSLEKDGYVAVQLGFDDVPERKLTKPELGHLKKAEASPKKVLKEFRLDNAAEMNVGDELKADVFAKGDKVDITGISRGKGYAGVIKRWNAHRLKESHGTGPVHRHAGAMSANSSPSKIFPGKIGAGQMGVEQVTVQNLEIVQVDANLNLIAVKGAVPGPNQGIVALKSTVKKNKIKHAASSRVSTNPQKRSARNA